MVRRARIVIAVMIAGCGADAPADDVVDATVDADPCAPIVSTAPAHITQWKIARIDGDAFPDMLVYDGTERNGFGNVRFLHGRGDGTFDALVPGFSGATWHEFFVEDVNADGHPDIIFGARGAGSTSIGVMTGNGDGRFTPGFSVDGNDAHILGVRRIDADTDLDIVAVVWDGAAWHLRPYLGDGAGGFQNSVDYTIANLTVPMISGALGDFDEDFDIDIAVATESAIVTYLGNNTGTFQTFANLAHQFPSPRVWHVADFDRTGSDDLLAAGGLGPLPWHILLGGGPPPFVDQRDRPITDRVDSPLVGDLDRDDNFDLVSGILGPTGDGIRILPGNGDGTFDPPHDISIPGVMPDSVAVGDIAGDFRNDIVYQRQDEASVEVILNACIP
jgi:hypothetical protein